jgi:isopenicillin N synthase-like dioxygenase
MTASRAFFALDEAVKARIAIDGHQRGWMAQGLANLEGSKTHDAKEVFFWGREVAADDPDVLAGLPLVHPNQWPDGAAPFLRTGILPYYRAVMALGLRILECLAIGLDADPAIFTRAYDRPLGRGQLVYYPAIGEADIRAERFGAAAHTDFGVLTILQQDSLGGLQVLNRSGDWIEAMPIEDTFVCNIGDLLERWTNGRLVSTRHRVLNRSGRSRYSIPIFCDPASDAVVDPRDFDRHADIEALPPIEAGAYIMGKNRRNFSHYDRQDS